MRGFQQSAGMQGKSTISTRRNTKSGLILGHLAAALGWDNDKLVVSIEYDHGEAKTLIHVWLTNRQGATFRIPDSELDNYGRVYRDREDTFPTPGDLAILRLLNQAEPVDGPNTRRQSQRLNKDLSLKR